MGFYSDVLSLLAVIEREVGVTKRLTTDDGVLTGTAEMVIEHGRCTEYLN